MSIINIEIYSIVILIVLLVDYISKFRKKFNTASLIWLILAISTLLISLSNIFFTLSNIYVVRLLSLIVYLLSTLISSLFVYIYVKFIYVNSQIDIKKEVTLLLASIMGCALFSVIFLLFSNVGYQVHSFDRFFINKLLILAIIPNAVICISYLIHCHKTGATVNHKILATLLLTIVGLIFDVSNDTLFFVSGTFTLTTLIIYINKHERLLNTDPLTGLANKRTLDTYIANLKENLLVCVLNMDIDKFKHINDKYGHLKGDLVLKRVASILRNSSRDCDLVIRNGGDEFLLVAEIKKKTDYKKIINRINSNLEKYNSNAEIKVSLSIGCGVFNTNSKKDFNEFLKETDESMYKEKEKNHKNLE